MRVSRPRCCSAAWCGCHRMLSFTTAIFRSKCLPTCGRCCSRTRRSRACLRGVAAGRRAHPFQALPRIRSRAESPTRRQPKPCCNRATIPWPPTLPRSSNRSAASMGASFIPSRGAERRLAVGARASDEPVPPPAGAGDQTAPTSTSESKQPICFVVSAFGVKVDYPTGRTLDLNRSYRVFKTAIEEAGLRCIRADEIPSLRGPDRALLRTAPVGRNGASPICRPAMPARCIFSAFGMHCGRTRRSCSASSSSRSPSSCGLCGSSAICIKALTSRPPKQSGSGHCWSALLRESSAASVVDSPVYTFMPSLGPPGAKIETPGMRSSRRHGGPPVCFVVMGYGQKTDFATGRLLDLDKSYQIIKAAAAQEGFECRRADEIAPGARPCALRPAAERRPRRRRSLNIEPECSLRAWRSPCPVATRHHCDGRGTMARAVRAGQTRIVRYKHLGRRDEPRRPSS